MLRTLVCALVASAMVVGVAEAKQKTKHKGHAVHGKLISFVEDAATKTGTLIIATKKQGEQTFTIPDGTNVYVAKEGGKPEKLTSPDGLKDATKEISVHVRLKEDNKTVAGVGLGFHHKKGKKPKE